MNKKYLSIHNVLTDRLLAGGVYCVKALRTRQEGIFSYFEAFSDNDGQFSAITLFLYTLPGPYPVKVQK